MHFGRDFDLPSCQAYGQAGLKVLEQQLAGNEWLAAGKPTIADVACMPYAALSHMEASPSTITRRFVHGSTASALCRASSPWTESEPGAHGVPCLEDDRAD